MAIRRRMPDTKLLGVLARLCDQRGRLTITAAAKLPYLVDLVAQNVLGRRIMPSAHHETWEHGVVTREAWAIVKHEKAEDLFKYGRHYMLYGGKTVSLRDDAPEDLLTEKERAVVDHVSELYGGLTARQLEALTKGVNADIPKAVWKTENRPASLHGDAFARLSAGWQGFWSRLPQLDLSDESRWGPAIEDPREHVRKALGG